MKGIFLYCMIRTLFHIGITVAGVKDIHYVSCEVDKWKGLSCHKIRVLLCLAEHLLRAVEGREPSTLEQVTQQAWGHHRVNSEDTRQVLASG